MLFVDTSNKDEAKKWIYDYSICNGITSNPKILLQDKNKNIKQVIEELIKVSKNYPINIELTNTNGTDDELVNEAADYVDDLKQQIVIKVPMWTNGRGLRIAKRLHQIGIQTNLTCCMSSEQVLLASLTEVNYVSLFFRRMVDYNVSQGNSTEEAYIIASEQIKCSANLLDIHGLETQLIVGSIRKPTDVVDALLNGADIVTVPPTILEQMFQHSATDKVIAEFNNAWMELQK